MLSGPSISPVVMETGGANRVALIFMLIKKKKIARKSIFQEDWSMSAWWMHRRASARPRGV